MKPHDPREPLVCERCGVHLQLDELRRESLDVLGQELLEVIVDHRIGFACPRCVTRGVISAMLQSLEPED